MSLDVYLIMPGEAAPVGSGIFIREDGANREISRAEWDERFPGREPVRVLAGGEAGEVYHANITHNLGRMAAEAGLYQALWHPDEIGATHAHLLIFPLEAGLARLRSDPKHYRALNPSNGWGTYEGLVRFVEGYLAACVEWPQAEVRVSR